MFEKFKFKYLMEIMLNDIPKKFDKREGSVIYDPLAAVALEFERFYIYLDMILNESFADTATYHYLAKRR